MENLYFVGSMNNWEFRQSFRFRRHDGGVLSLLVDLNAGRHEFKIAAPGYNPESHFGAEGPDANISINQPAYLKAGGSNISLELSQSGIYFLSFDVSRTESNRVLRIEPKHTRAPSASGADTHALEVEHFLDMKLPVTFEIGRASLLIGEALSLGQGSIIELDSLEGEPVRVYVRDKLVALGELCICGEEFSVRILDILPSK